MVREGGSLRLTGSETCRIGPSAILCLPNELRCCADTGKAWWSYNRRDTGKPFEQLSGLGGGRASSCPVQRLLMPGRQAAGKDMGLRGGRSRGAVLPASSSKGIGPSTGRELALLLFLSHPSFSLNKAPNPTRCTFERKMV